MTLFSKKNDIRLQFLENKLLSISECDMMTAQYFHKAKSLYLEISKLDSIIAIEDVRIKKE